MKRHMFTFMVSTVKAWPYLAVKTTSFRACSAWTSTLVHSLKIYLLHWCYSIYTLGTRESRFSRIPRIFVCSFLLSGPENFESLDPGSILFAPEDPPKRAPVLFAFSVSPSPHTFWGSVALCHCCNKFGLFRFFFGCFGLCTHFEFPTLRNSSCHWSLKLLGDDLHLERQNVVCRRRSDWFFLQK